MKTAQWTWPAGSPLPDTPLGATADVVLAFGARAALAVPDAAAALGAAHPNAQVIGCSSGGEILGAEAYHDGLSVTAIDFDRTTAVAASVSLEAGESARDTGRRLAGLLPPTDRGGPLAHVLLFIDGVGLNGSEFTRGIGDVLPPGVEATGGLAADDDCFEQTPLWANGPLDGPGAVAVGLYGTALTVGHGAVGGWEPFGPERLVTASEGAVLQGLDGQSALALYRRYLGPHADALPASGLRFPLSVRVGDGPEVIRTLLGIDDDAGTMTFAGDVPQGARARLMRANPERLIEGAAEAARAAAAGTDPAGALALMVSCVGRKWVLGQRVEEEIEAAALALPGATLAGFYSYGEIAPSAAGDVGQLHNQTMTITVLAEG